MGLRGLAERFETGALERAVERDVEAEIEAHLAEATAVLEAEGLASEEARRIARERFGDLERIRAECLQVRMGGMLAMKKLFVVCLVAMSLALLATLAAARMFYMRARMAQEVAVAERMQAQEAAHRALAAEAEAKAELQEIVVGVGDALQLVETHGHVQPAQHPVVQSDGKVLIPDAGWVDVAGLTREQVEERLRQRLAPFYEELELYVVVHKPKSTSPCLKAPITTFTSVLFRAF